MEIKKNENKKVITIDFPIATGKGHLTCKQKGKKDFEYTVNIGLKEEKISANKPPWNIGSNNQCVLFKRLSSTFDQIGVAPNFGLKGKAENMDKFSQELHLHGQEMKKIMKEWAPKDEGKKDFEDISFFKKTNSYETFDKETKIKAKELIENNEFLQFAVDVMSTTTRAQRPKLTFCFLIAISAILKKPLNSLCIASPSAGKSQINEAVFNVFPVQRKIRFDSETSIPGLTRMTQYKEGKHILQNLLIYIADLGNEDELKKQNVVELLSVLKRLISSQQYKKIIANTQSDAKEAMVLEIEGFGALLAETTARSPEAQFADRSVIWSPDESNEIWNEIISYLTSDLKQWIENKRFERKRPTVAAGIEMIYQKVESFDTLGYDFKIFNPFKRQMMEKDKIFKTPVNKITPRTINQIVNMPKMVSLTNILAHQFYVNKECKTIAIILSPKEYFYALETIEKPLAYMISPISENTLSYIHLIEDYFYDKGDWPYTFADYRTGFSKGFESMGDEEAQESFDTFIAGCHPITKVEIKQLKDVSATTAGGYLEELVNMELLYLKNDGTRNNYYVISDFIEKKEAAGMSLLSKDDLSKGSALWEESQEIYDQFLEEMMGIGFEEFE